MGDALSRGLSDRALWAPELAADPAARPDAILSAAHDAYGACLYTVRDFPRAFQRSDDACADLPRRRIREHGVSQKTHQRAEESRLDSRDCQSCNLPILW